MFISFAVKRSIGWRSLEKTVSPLRSFSLFGANRSSPSSSSSSKDHSHSHQQPHNDLTLVPPILSSSVNFDSFLVSLDHCSVAVAYQPKLRLVENKFAQKRIDISSPTGEDNLFVLKQINGSVAFGVADGVGGWADKGYDSLAISRQLCASLRAKFESRPETSLPDLLSAAYDETINTVEVGGTTACFGVLSADARTLNVLNLGDSWCGLFRDSHLVQQTRSQTHAFNTPYQLSKVPEVLVAEAASKGRHYILDSPADADVYTWKVQKGDIVMFATDGVTDNIAPGDTEIFLRDNKSKSLDKIASTFVDLVVKLSKDTRYNLVFSQELSKVTGQLYSGGKEDDITVVLVHIQ